MTFRQFVDEDLGCASYLVGDAEAGEAIVVDPAFAIEQYLDAAAEERVRIVRVSCPGEGGGAGRRRLARTQGGSFC